MFRTVPLSIIRSFSLYTQQWYITADSLRAGSGRTSWSCSQAVSKPVWHIPLLCLQWKTPDDVQWNCPKHVEFYSKNKFEKLVHLVGFITRIYHNAQSAERQTPQFIAQVLGAIPPLQYASKTCRWIVLLLFIFTIYSQRKRKSVLKIFLNRLLLFWPGISVNRLWCRPPTGYRLHIAWRQCKVQLQTSVGYIMLNRRSGNVTLPSQSKLRETKRWKWGYVFRVDQVLTPGVKGLQTRCSPVIRCH